MLKIFMAKILESLKLTPLYNLILPLYHKKQLFDWLRKDKKTFTPHSIKQQVIKEYAKNEQINTFVETGTYLGIMVSSIKNIFDSIYTIELDPRLYRHCKKKFSKFENIKVIYGDSRKKLPQLMKKIRRPAIFWLDAHYSSIITAGKDDKSTIVEELEAILNHDVKNHIILIDDAHAFKGARGFPSIDSLRNLLTNIDPDRELKVKNDIIHIRRK